MQVTGPRLDAHPITPSSTREDFDAPQLPIDFQWLRSPWPEELFSLSERPGYLRLYGRETIGSSFRQALVARRQQSHCFSATILMEFAPEHYQQAAGLVCYYGASKFHYLFVSHDSDMGRYVRVMSGLPNSPQGDAFTSAIRLADGPVHLGAEVDYERLRFAFSLDGVEWQWLPDVL